VASDLVYDKSYPTQFVDLTGRRYGKWVVLRRDTSIPPGHGSFWVCQCECSTIATVPVDSLTSGKSTSCGCGHAPDMVSKKFGRWTVTGRDTSKPKGRAYWLVECECGSTGSILGSNLRNGSSQSCGCLNVDAHSTHGMKYTPEYQAWRAMINRCYRPEDISFHNYGGRGIQVAAAWLESFEQFFTHVGPRPTPQHSLDRYPDKDGNYEPGNVRWATLVEQQNNMRTNHLLTYQGKTQTIAQWARELGINHLTLRGRIQNGWSVERALTTPVRK
jgi:hypothetical protein